MMVRDEIKLLEENIDGLKAHIEKVVGDVMTDFAELKK